MKHLKIFESYTKDELKVYLKEKIAWSVVNHAEYLATKYIDDNYTFAYSIWVSDTGSLLNYSDFFCLYDESGEFCGEIDSLTIGKMYGDKYGFLYCISIGSAPGYDKRDCKEVLESIIGRMCGKYSLDVQSTIPTDDLINGYSSFLKVIQ